MVVALEARARLGLRLCLADRSDAVEFRSSSGMKNRSSSKLGDVVFELVADPKGRAGTGGTINPGDSVGDLLMTPGIYAICMTLDARVRTVDAIDPIDRVDCLASRFRPP